MSYLGFPPNNYSSSFSYGGYNTGSPMGDASSADFNTDSLQSAGHETESHEAAKSEKKTGIKGFFEGMKNGLVNTVKALFTVKGALLTAGTIALVAATGGAALLPLALVGVGVGTYQVGKGIYKGDAEQVGEGAFTVGASLIGAKIAPNSIGGNQLANTSLLGKLTAPFGGKGTFSNSQATFWGASKEATTSTFASLRARFPGGKATNAGTQADTASSVSSTSETPFSDKVRAASGGKIPPTSSSASEIAQQIPGAWKDTIDPKDSVSNIGSRSNEAQPKSGVGGWFQTKLNAMKNHKGFNKAKDYFVANTGGNPQNPQGSGSGAQVTFSERAQNLLQEAKNSPHTASSWMGTTFGGASKSSKPVDDAGSTYY